MVPRHSFIYFHLQSLDLDYPIAVPDYPIMGPEGIDCGPGLPRSRSTLFNTGMGMLSKYRTSGKMNPRGHVSELGATF